MAERLEIIIDVNTKDGSPKVQKLQGDLKTLGAAASQADDVIAAGLNPSLAGMGQLAATGGPMLLAAAAAVAILAAGAVALGFSLKEAFAAEQEVAQLNAVLKSTGQIAGITSEAALSLADSLSRVSGVSDETILAGENILLTFTEIGKKVFPQAAAAALDLSTAFGMDLNSASIMLGKALQDPIQGLTALRRVGVSFSDAQAQMIIRMAEGGRVAQAQALILREVNRQVAGSAEAMGSTTIGEWNKIKNIIGNAAESIGGVFLPFINAGLTNMRILFQGLFDGVEPALKRLGSAFQDLVKAFNTREMRKAWEELSKAIGESFGDTLLSGVESLADGVEKFAEMWSEYGPEIVKTATDILEVIEKLDSALKAIGAGLSLALGSAGGLGNLPGFAGGVTNFGGGMAVVGERGPETVILPRGSSVLPDGGAAARDAGGVHIHGDVIVRQERGATLTDLLRGTNVMRLGTT